MHPVGVITSVSFFELVAKTEVMVRDSPPVIVPRAVCRRHLYKYYELVLTRTARDALPVHLVSADVNAGRYSSCSGTKGASNMF